MRDGIFLIGDADSEELINSLKRYLSSSNPSSDKDAGINDYIYSTSDSVLHAFDDICEFIGSTANVLSLRRCIGIITLASFKDLCRFDFKPDFLDTSQEKKNPFAVLATLLIWSFPEISWYFWDRPDSGRKDRVDTYGDVDLTAETMRERLIISKRFPPIFDPLRLKEYIKECLIDPHSGSGNKTWKLVQHLLPRTEVAASIDEEEAYAYLHGYLAYKLGYRNFLVTTQEMMDKLFKEDSKIGGDISLTFEDVFLNFPDRTPTGAEDVHLSNLKERDSIYKKLQAVRKRVFITVGHTHIQWKQENKDYISLLKSSLDKVKIIYKPSGGMFNILEKSGLLKDYRTRKKEELGKASQKDMPADAGGHSAPGRLLVIATRLIERADKIYHEAKSVQDCIHGATLALEAQELLGYRTPTTCLEAIALRHKLEVKAECMFYGVEYNIDVKNRLKEIKSEVDAASKWFHPDVQERSSLNAQMSIVTEIMRIFKDYGEFDEEQECLKCFRKLNRQWYFKNHPWIMPLRPLRWYMETLIGSFPLFVLAVFLWPFLLGTASWGLEDFGKKSDGFGSVVQCFQQHIVNAFSTFLGLQPAVFPNTDIALFVTTLLMFGGFLHLGIFISHLYTLISRR